ncbi:MAG: succinate dehydrogenase, cytochrome b556 subunit [Limnobacter sp.]|nr:succinate dehydrogenase, cytochrome b556 subunit [Limnobacter sp.]
MADAVDKPAGAARPEFRNIHVTEILGYRMPLAAIVSILHRVSGALLFLIGLPFLLYLLQQSLLSEISFENYRAIASHWFAKLVLLALAWAYLHHFCAGIRHLFLDLDIGTDKPKSRTSAAVVLAISLTLTLLVAAKIFGVF